MKAFDIRAMKARLDDLAARAPADRPVHCVACRDTGVIAVVESGSTRERQCPSCHPRGTFAGVPKPFEGVTLAKVRALPGGYTRALQKAKDFVSTSATRDLLLYGPVGTGKTHLAIATGAEFCATHGRSGLFVRWPMTLHQLQPGSLDDDARRRLEHQLFSAPLLVVDDIGAERDTATDFTRRMAYLMYEARGDADLPTILTTNLTLDELAAHQADDRLTSRLAGRCDVVKVDGADQRVGRRLKAV